jgi:hypothetical protein
MVEVVDYSRCLAPPESVNRTTRGDIHICVTLVLSMATGGILLHVGD